MDSRNPDELIAEVKDKQQTRGELATEALQWFLDGNVGEVFPRGDVVDRLSNELDIPKHQANTAISDTVGDIVDPVQQVVKGDKKYVGVIDYKIFNDEGAYGYVDFDDRKGGRKRVVCARCVEEHKYDENITHATQGEGSSNKDATWQRLLNQVTGHYADNHIKPPSDIEPGASLVSGTTISGNTAFHSGNESNIDHNNLSNRTHSGDDLSPSSVSSNTLEATSTINTADISAASTGDALKKGASGSDLEFGSVGIWEEDANSPLSGSGSQSHTITLSQTYDLVLVVIKQFENDTFSDQRLELVINGEIRNDYDFVNASGTETVGSDTFKLVDNGSFSPGNNIRGTVLLSGKKSDRIGITADLATDEFISDLLEVGRGFIGGNTLESITFRGGSDNIIIEAGVYGVTV